jgi:adenylosuccinate lyase
MTQSPVEFYREQLHALVSMRESKFETEREIFDQAKQMEKEQKEALYTKEEVASAMLQISEYITEAVDFAKRVDDYFANIRKQLL